MQTRTAWKEKMLFSGESEGNRVDLDAKTPIGSGGALTPKELVAIAISGCTAMDVVALLKKYKQPLESLDVIADVVMKENVHPIVFSDVSLTFTLAGNLDPAKVTEAIHLSQTKYCSVSAMLAKAVPIHYRVVLNGNEIGRGEASFEIK
jgi:putative redox protein